MSHKTERSWPSLKQRSSGRWRIAKAIIAQFDGKQPTCSYFDGCSDGGREALMEAQRYPNDVDGIVAGAPANDLVVQNTVHHAWNVLANRDANGNPILLAGKLPLIHGAVVAACDRLDGVADWLINDPRRCHSDPASLLCSPGQDGTSCLTDAEAGVVRRLHDDATDAQGHRLEQRVSHEWRSEPDWARASGTVGVLRLSGLKNVQRPSCWWSFHLSTPQFLMLPLSGVTRHCFLLNLQRSAPWQERSHRSCLLTARFDAALLPRIRPCPIAFSGLAGTGGYSGREAALGDLGDMGAQALGKGQGRRRERAAARQDQPRRPVGGRDRQRHHAQRAAYQVADHQQPRHHREQVGSVQHLPDETVGTRTERTRRVDPEQREQVLDLPANALGDGWQHEVVAPEVVKAHLRRRKQRVPGAGKDRDRLGPERLALEAVRHRRFV